MPHDEGTSCTVCSQGCRVCAATNTGNPGVLGEEGVPKKRGSNWLKIEIDAIESMQQFFARCRNVRGKRGGPWRRWKRGAGRALRTLAN